VKSGTFDVVGKSSVVVIDARGAKIEKAVPGALATGRDLKLSVLKAGQSYKLK
jgi:hypothetical protein